MSNSISFVRKRYIARNSTMIANINGLKNVAKIGFELPVELSMLHFEIVTQDTDATNQLSKIP